MTELTPNDFTQTSINYSKKRLPQSDEKFIEIMFLSALLHYVGYLIYGSLDLWTTRKLVHMDVLFSITCVQGVIFFFFLFAQ